MSLGIISAGAGYMGQQEQAKQQREFAQQTASNAATAAQTQYDNLNRRAAQEDAAANQQRQEQNLEVARMTASTEVAAAEAGVSGLSVDHVLRDFYAQAGRRSAAISTNQQMSRGYLDGEKQAARAGGQSQANAVPIPETPSPLVPLISVFGSGLNTYTDYVKRTS